MTKDQRAQVEALAVWHQRQSVTAARLAFKCCPHGGREEREAEALLHEEAARLLRQLTQAA